MDGPNFYNEIDPYTAQWLRNLIAAGHIAPGVVDERSVEDIKPEELYGYTQCHFFAGVGVWSLALRHAGWPDDRPIWTGSCPCQPFSAAGKGAGFADERHLWPAFHHLIAECRPPIILGEQVASGNVNPWIDLVHADLEALDYSFGGVPFPSAGIGAPHIRDRLYWVADANDSGRQRGRAGKARDGRDAARIEPERLRDADGLADALCARPLPGALARVHRSQEGAGAWNGEPQRLGAVIGMADANDNRFSSQPIGQLHDIEHHAESRDGAGEGLPGPTNGYWAAADWLGCRDGKWRPVEPGTFPLAHGAPARVGRLRAYGNAINGEQARIFIQAVMESL